MMLAAFLVGMPIFFEVGFIILVPLVYSLTREGKPNLFIYKSQIRTITEGGSGLRRNANREESVGKPKV